MNQIDTQAFGRKSKKGSSTNAQNTLRSNTRARLLMVLSEGPISGLVNGAKSIYREQTPIQNPDDTFNFDNFYFEEHKGYPDDAPFSGNGAAGSIVSVEAQADFNTPVQRTVVEKDADALNVIVRVNSLFRVDKSKGTMQTNSVAYVIEVRAAGGTWETAVTNHLIDQKTMSPTQIAHRVELPLNGSPWDVRLRRLTADEVEEENQSDIYFESYVILVEGKFTMPHTAALQMEVNAEDIGGNIGTLAFHVKGRLIEVPSNYDPVTRAYTGIWDGTFKVAYCNCPPWIFRDLIVNDRFGLGEFVNAASVDKWALYNIARYCDGLVPSGYKDAQGNDIMEPRYTFNGVISGREEAFNVLRQMTATWRGMGYWSLGQMTATADMPEDPFCLVSPANVIDGDFNYSSTATKARYSVVLVRFSDPNDFYRDAVEPVINDEMLRRFGWREKTVTLKGCTSRSAAHRYGRWILDVDQYETETVTYRAGLDQLNVVPGRIVAITDPRKAEVRMGGRVVSQAETQITLDAPLEMTQGVSYTITWKTPAGTLMSRSVTSAAGAVLTVPAVPVADRAQANAMYALSSTEVNPRQYRVLGVTEVEPEIYQVTALFHDPQKYARVERGIVFDPPSYTKKREKPAAPTNLVVLETGTLTNTSQRSRLTLSWTPPLGTLVSGFMVEITSPDTGREALPITTSTQVDYPVVEPGVYSFSVKTVDILGQISNPATMQHTVLGDAGFGTSTVTDLALASGGTIFTGADVRLVWKNKFPTSMAPGAGDAVAIAETSPLYSHNMIKIMRADTLEVLRSVRVTTAGLTYDFEANKADNQVLGKAPARQLRFDVQAFDVHGAYSPVNSIVVSNPVPAMVSPNVTSEGNVIRVTWKMPDEQDVTGTRVWIETNNTFDPDATTPKFDSTGSLFLFTGAATAIYYVRVGVYDGFSKQLLNVSAPIEISTGRVPLLDTDTPGTVTGLALSSVLGLDGKSKLIATWAASSATGLTGYDVEMRVSGGNWVSFTTSAIRYEWEVVSGTSYDVRVKARNYASRSGNYSTILTHVAAANTTPPAVPAGLTITPGFATFWLKWTANSEPDLAYYEIYESDVTTAPTDSTVATFTSTGSSFVRSGMGDNQTRHYWLRACRSTGPTSVVKSAWSARVQSTTTASVGVTTEALAGLVDATSFAANLEPVGISSSPTLPTTKTTSTIMWQNKLYRWNGTAYVASVASVDITGQLTASQIAALEATKITGVLSNTQIADLDAAKLIGTVNEARIGTVSAVKVTGTLTNAQIAALDAAKLTGTVAEARLASLDAAKLTGTVASARISALEAVKLTGQITGTQISDGSISSAKVAAGAITAGNIAAGAVTADKITANWLQAGALVIGPSTSFAAPEYDPSTKVTADYVNSRGENLITNGTLALGDNTNFSQFQYDGEIALGGGSVYSTDTNYTKYNDEYLFVNPDLTYRLNVSITKKPGTNASQYYIGVVCYDIDKNFISPQQTMRIADTRLAQPLKPGDTKVYLTSSAGFYNGNGASYLRQLLIWGYKNSRGYTYPDYTYTRLMWQDAWAENGVNTSTHVITLRSPLPGYMGNPDSPTGTWPTGQAVSNGSAGGTFKYIGGSGNTSDEWVKCTGTISGVDLSGNNQTNAFAPGTASIKLLFLGNRTGVQPLQTHYANLEFCEEKADAALLNSWQSGTSTLIDGGKIFTGSVTANQIAAGAISAGKIAAGAIVAGDIAAGTITGAKIATNTITATQIAVGTITANEIASNAITASELAANAVTATHIVAGTITANELASNSVTTAKIAAGAVTADQIAANSIVASKMLVSDRNNLLLDGSFEEKNTGNYSLSLASSGSILWNSTAKTGAVSMEIRKTTLTDAVSLVSRPELYTIVEEYEVYYAETEARTLSGTATAGFYFRIRWYNNVGTYLSYIDIAGNVGLTTTWQKFFRKVTAPVNAAYAGIQLYNNSTNTVVGSFLVDRVVLRRANAGELIVDGALTANMVGTNELITNSANIKDAIITDAKIANLSAAKLTAGTALAGSVTVSGTALSTIQSQANDPAARINAASTKINPGQVLISGSTTLSSWQRGGDTTKIDGGAISANTIAANKLEIGSRNITLTGIVFDYNSPSTNRVSWTSGTIKYIDDAGVAQSRTISASSSTWSSGVLFLYWIKDSSTIYATTSQATALGANNVILATYEGGTKLDADYGRTIVDGGSIKTNSITATQIAASTITATQIAASTITATQIAANAVTASQIAANAVTAVKISAGTITTDKLNASSFSASGLAVFGSAVKSTNFVSGSAGWSIYQNGSAEFNGVVISRPLQVDSGRVTSGSVSNIPSDTPTVLATYYVYATGVPLNAWSGANKSYNAEAGLSNTSVSTGNSANCYFGVVATVLPLTQFSGSQTLRLKLEIVVRNVNSINPASGGTFNIDWRIYEVT